MSDIDVTCPRDERFWDVLSNNGPSKQADLGLSRTPLAASEGDNGVLSRLTFHDQKDLRLGSAAKHDPLPQAIMPICEVIEG